VGGGGGGLLLELAKRLFGFAELAEEVGVARRVGQGEQGRAHGLDGALLPLHLATWGDAVGVRHGMQPP
jgi:hypothetical protein